EELAGGVAVVDVDGDLAVELEHAPVAIDADAGEEFDEGGFGEWRGRGGLGGLLISGRWPQIAGGIRRRGGLGRCLRFRWRRCGRRLRGRTGARRGEGQRHEDRRHGGELKAAGAVGQRLAANGDCACLSGALARWGLRPRAAPAVAGWPVATTAWPSGPGAAY